MLGITLVEILDGRSSPSRWYKNANTRDQCKYVGLGITPSRSSWYTFRDRCSKFIENVADQTVQLAIKDGILEPSVASLDGTFTRAAASRHRILNSGQIHRRIEKLQLAVEVLDTDSETDADVQKNLREEHEIPKWIGNTLAGRQRQLSQFKKAESTLKMRIETNATKPKKFQSDPEKMTISPWDVNASIGRDKEKVLAPIYNTQFVVAPHSDIVLSYGVFAQNTDSGTLVPMIQRTQEVVGGLLTTILADAGYCSLLEVKDCQELSIDLYAPVVDSSSSKNAADGTPQLSQKDFTFYPEEDRCVCPAGHEMRRRSCGKKPRADGRDVLEVRYEQTTERCGGCELVGKCLLKGSSRRSVGRMEGQELLDEHAVKMSTDRGKSLMKLRGQSVERLFGDGKLHRNQNQQNGRGIDRVSAEVGLLVVAQNALRTHNLRRAPGKTHF